MFDPTKAAEICGHQFKDQALVKEALAAKGSGAHNGMVDHERLAALGNRLVDLLSYQKSFDGGFYPPTMSDRLAADNTRRAVADAAEKSGLNACIGVSPAQQGSQIPPVAASNAIKALLAAVWIDSSKDFYEVTRVAEALSLKF